MEEERRQKIERRMDQLREQINVDSSISNKVRLELVWEFRLLRQSLRDAVRVTDAPP